MNSPELPYIQGMADTLANACHLDKTAALHVASQVTQLSKQAALFNFSDSQGGGFSASSLLLPLLAAAASGYVAYNAGAQGDKRKSAFQNIKNYLGRNLSKLTRDTTPVSINNFWRTSTHNML